MITLSVSLENWRKIRKKAKELNLKHNNEVISYLLDIEKKYMSSELPIGKITSGENRKKGQQNNEDNSKNNDMWDI